jgi:hypothetical protein
MMKHHVLALLLGLAGRRESARRRRSPRRGSTVAAGLPHPPREITVPGNHFVFIDPCPPDLAAKVPAICQDALGVDRAAIHRRLEGKISDFLQQNL